MNRSHDELREALGAYVLGQLDDVGLRRDLQEHLATCAECRAEVAEIGPLAAALRQVDPDDVRPVGIAPPPELDERVRLALPLPAPTRRRWTPVVSGVLVGAAAAALVAVVVVTRDDAPDGPTIVAVDEVESSPGVTASAGLVDHTWGLEIKLEVTGLPADEIFEMWVTDDDGGSHAAGEFVGVADKTITCDMSSSVLLAHATRFVVVDGRGAEVVAADLPS